MAKNPTAKKPSARKPSPPEDTEKVSIHFNTSVNMPSVFATNLLIQQGEHEMILSFFEIQPPFLIGTADENLALLKKVGLRADCMARITISKERFEGFADAMKKAATDMKAASKEKK